ncbi:MAG TPA: Do family serine endopeptidase [Polyangia bacterium]|nr:Do family serine endopeptidase [Polyangia bacterium]
MRLRAWAPLLIVCAGSFIALGAARAEEPLWTEGSSRGGLPANAPINMQSFVKLARTLGPSVVNVVALQNGDDPRDLLQSGSDHPKPRGKGQGTGFVIHKSGYILTNSHVIESADDIRVRLADERELTARLIGTDERTDIALLKVEAGGDLPVAPLGNSDDVQIGEWVVAIGNPFGLDHTVTAGIVSAKGRRDVRPGGSQTGYYDFIQTDASINPGNSGGPLINSRGEVIGINTAMNAQAQGIGFAIPINMAKVIVPLLKAHGRAPRSWLGVYPQSITASLRKAFALGDTKGALISDVVADSPAAHAGLLTGDVVSEFDGHVIKRADDLMWLVATAPAGKKVGLTVHRAGKTFKVETTLQGAPDEQQSSGAPSRAPSGKRSPLGMTVSEISPGIARELGNPSLRGVVVMSVEPESPAVEAGVERGDLILRVGETMVEALDDYAKAVRALAHGEMIRMLVRRDGKNLWVAFPKR